MDNGFDGRVVWITGASSGIGEALAYALSGRGARLILSARRAERLEEVRARCNGVKANVSILPLDVADAGSLPGIAARARSLYGRIDVLVNNAGISQRALALDTAPDVVRSIMETNFFGAVALATETARAMIEQGGGRIVVVSSFVGKVASPLRSTYSASKHALHGYFDALRAELHAHGVSVLIVIPGFIKTEISLHALEGSGREHGVMDSAQQGGMSARRAAERIVRAIAAGSNELYVGFDARLRLALLLKSAAPRVLARMMRGAKVT